MNRNPVNPWKWSLNVGYNQAEVISDVKRQLVCAGQTAVDEQGRPQYPDDMRSQMALAMENLTAILIEADMDLVNVIRLGIYTTNVDETLKHFDVLGSRFGQAGIEPPMTLLGVARLAMPELMFEIEVTAAD